MKQWLVEPRAGGGLDDRAALARVGDLHHDLLVAECALFLAAADWADRYHPDSRKSGGLFPEGERALLLGGVGTPEMLEFGLEEFAAKVRQTKNWARSYIADALDARHRLPKLWRLVVAGVVRVWQIREVARSTRLLSLAAARQVDAEVAATITQVNWGRFVAILDGRIKAADPALAERQAQLMEATRQVRLLRQRTVGTGLRTLLVEASAGDVIALYAVINRLADILAVQGSTASADHRRADAIGILANPALAAKLLYEHAAEPDPGPAHADYRVDADPVPTEDHPAEPTLFPDHDPATAPEDTDQANDDEGCELDREDDALMIHDAAADQWADVDHDPAPATGPPDTTRSCACCADVMINKCPGYLTAGRRRLRPSRHQTPNPSHHFLIKISDRC